MTTQSSPSRWALTLVTVAAALLSAGCVAAERPSTKPPVEPTYTPPAAAPAAPAGGAAAAPVGARVSAGSASEEQIFSALSRAGVPDPGRWTEQVIGARPYPPGDANLTKLRSALAPLHPAPGVVDKIVSALSP